MRDAPGVGLAAPQIGESIQLVVIEDPPQAHAGMTPAQLAERERSAVALHVLINPRLTVEGDEQVAAYEGCLSLAGFSMIVPRWRRVRVELVCADPAARDRSPARRGVLRPDGSALAHHPGQPPALLAHPAGRRGPRRARPDARRRAIVRNNPAFVREAAHSAFRGLGAARRFTGSPTDHLV